MIQERSAKSLIKKILQERPKLYEEDIDIRSSYDEKYTSANVAVDIFKEVHVHYINDINAVWNRSKFFSAIDGGLIAFYYSQYSPLYVPNSKLNTIVISVIGLTISFLWIWMAWVTRKWLHVWRTTLVKMEGKLVVNGPFKYGEMLGGKEMYHKLRPEYFSVILAVSFTLAWLFTLIQSLAACRT